jgi:hypothetical protein
MILTVLLFLSGFVDILGAREGAQSPIIVGIVCLLQR